MCSTPIYEKLLPLYFPRSPEEEAAAKTLLPQDTGITIYYSWWFCIGDEYGEPIVEARKIRIGAFPVGPQAKNYDDDDDDEDDEESGFLKYIL